MAIKVTLIDGTKRIFKRPDCYGGYIGWDVYKNGSLHIAESNINAYAVHCLASFPDGEWKSVEEIED